MTLHQESNLPTKESGCKHEKINTVSYSHGFKIVCAKCGFVFDRFSELFQ